MTLEEKREYRRKWRLANKEKIKQRAASYRVANAETENRRSAAYYAANKENLKKYHAAYAKANPAKYAALRARRRAAQIQATPAWAHRDLILAIYERAQELGMHVDHIAPLSHGLVCGLHTQFNLQLLTPEANMKKGNTFHVS